MASLRAPDLPPVSTGQVVYPEPDGQPVGETDQHITQILWVLAMLREYFVFDPLGEYLDLPLVRFRLAEHDGYVRKDGSRLDS